MTDRAEASPLPPHSIEAEQSVLGAILLDNSVLDRINGSLSGEHFYIDSHRLIFESEQALHGKGQPIDVTTLQAALEVTGKLDYCGGLAFLGSLVQNVPTAANAGHYVTIVRDRAGLRRLIENSRQIADAARAPGANIDELLGVAQSRFDKLVDDIDADAHEALVKGPKASVCGDLRGREIEPPPFLVQRILPMEVARVVGGGGAGKTTLLLTLAMSIATNRAWFGHPIEQPGNVLVVSAEDSEETLRYRLQKLARAADLGLDDYAAIETGIFIEDWSGKAAGRLAEPDRYGRLVESPSVNRLIKEYGNSNVRLVICDPLSLLGPGERFVNDGEIEVARICRKIGSALKCAVLMVHHVSQAVTRNAITDQHAGRGGTAGADNSRCVWQLAPPPIENVPPEVARAIEDGNQVLYVWFHKVSHGPQIIEPLVIERTGWLFRRLTITQGEPGQGVGGVDLGARAGADAERVLRYFKASTDYRRDEVEGSAGVPRDRARTALATLLREGRIVEHQKPPEKGKGRPLVFLRLPPKQATMP